MKNIVRALIVAMLATFMFSINNCTYKNAEDVFPVDTSNCKTANMSYVNDIVPILMANHCYTCHTLSTSYLGDGYRLDTYAYLIVQIGPNPQYDDILYGNLVAPDNTTSHMPQGGYPDMSPCDITKIKAWIDQGYKNN